MNKIHEKHFPFKTIRPKQKEVIDKLKNNWDKYRFIVLDLPTGFGKSALAKTIGASTKSAFLLTATKQLQDQYMRDFYEPEVVSLKGRANYQCNLKPELNVECGLCVGNYDQLKHCKQKRLCSYYNQRDKALNAEIALTSYHYFLYSCLCGGFWKPRDVLIIDECHLLESNIVQWATVKISPSQLLKEHNITLEPYTPASGYDANKSWLFGVYHEVRKKRDELFDAISDKFDGKTPDELSEADIDDVLTTHKDYYAVDKLYKSLDIFFGDDKCEEWLIEPEDDGLLLTPIAINTIFQRYIARWGKKIIFMSATVLDMKGFCENLRLPKDETALLRVESDFPPEQSPIIYMPAGDMSFSKIDENIPTMLEKVEQILKKHKDEKGIIHTSNYKLAKAIVENIQDDRLLMRQGSENNESLVYRHLSSDEPTVLVSPSLTTGADLYDDLSRFQIIVKLPWLSLSDKRIYLKSRMEPDWYTAEMFRTFVQASGRSTRSEDDWSTTYVLDDKFRYWVWNARSYLPKQFIRRIRWDED